MGDTANLQIRVSSSEAELADRRLTGLEKQGYKTQRATDGLTSSFKNLLGPLLASVSAFQALSKITNVTREFDVLNAQLITATGSSENAAVAFEAIQDFATETPFDLQQVTEGFVKLVNLGLTPSEKALTSYGNTASAMGKDLNQLIEAVADAATGEFERLKEFGIKARSQGDQVSFTFRGVTTTIGKNAAEIEQYLMALGENEFAGAMLQRMNTLDGALSNLGDEWDKLFLNISNQGIGDLIEDTVRTAISVLEELNAQIASGQLDSNILNIRQSFVDWGTDIQNLENFMLAMFQNLEVSADKAGVSIDGSIGHLPQNIRAFIQLMTVELAAFIDKTGAYGDEILENLQFWRDETFDLDARLKQIDQARMDSINTILEERDVSVDRYDAEAKRIQVVRQEYDKLQQQRRSASEDALEGFGVGATGDSGETDAERKAREKGEKELERIRQQLLTEEEAIQESYQRRTEIILANTEFASAQQSELLTRLEQQKNEQLQALRDAEFRNQMQGYSSLFDGLSGLAKTFAGEQSGIYKGLFAASKAFAIADSIVKIQQGIASAAASPFPENLAAIGTVASATTGILSTIQGTNLNFAGSFDAGGRIPSGSVGIVGEIGPELVSGPANVTGRRDTESLLGGERNVTIQNNNLVLYSVNQLAGDLVQTPEFEEGVMNVINVNNSESAA